MAGLLVLLIIAFFGYRIWTNIKNRNEGELAQAQFLNLSRNPPAFWGHKTFLHPRGINFISLDNTRRQILIGYKLSKAALKLARLTDPAALLISYKVLQFDDVIKTEMVMDGQTIVRDFTTLQTLTHYTPMREEYSKKYNYISLKLMVNNVVKPAYEIVFYTKGIQSGTPAFAKKNCQDWQDTLTVALRATQPATS